jgi:hypothetical protein
VAATKAETVMLKLDEQIAGAADRATGALGRLENQIAREQNALGRLDQSLVLAKMRLGQIASGGDKGVVDILAYKRQQMAVQALGDKIGAQKDKIASLGEKATAAKGATEQLGGALKLVGDKAGVSSSQAAQLASSLAELGPYGAAAAAALLIMGGAITLVVGIIAKGITSAGEMRDEFLKLKAASIEGYGGLSWMYNGMVASNAAAETMQNVIDRVSVSTARSREELVGYAAQVRAAHFSGKDFETVLKTMAIAGAGGNKERSAQFLAMARDARYFGKSIDELADRVKKKLGPLADEELLGIDVQLKNLGKNIKWIFGDSDIKPILKVTQSFLSLLNVGSPTATSLRDAITLLVETAINKFLKLTIVLLKTYIWLKEHKAAWMAIKLVVAIVGIAFLTLAAAIGLVIAGAVLMGAVMMAPFVLILAGIGLFVKSIYDIATDWRTLWEGVKLIASDAWNWISGIFSGMTAKFLSVGSDIIGGIVSGIKAAGGAIWGALKGAVGGAIDSVKSFLGIASPSKLFKAEIGYQMAAGAAEGVDAGAGEVADSATKMASGGAKAAASAANDNAGSGSSAGKTFNFYNCDFGGATEETIRRWMHNVLETDSLDAAVPA